MKYFSPNALKTLRIKRGVTQDQLADVVGVAQQTVAKWESRKRSPGLDTIVKLSNYFNVSLDYLLGRSSNPNFEYRLGTSEAELVEDYRAVDDEKKKCLLYFADFLKTQKLTSIGGNIGIQHQTSKSIMSVGGEHVQNTINNEGSE